MRLNEETIKNFSPNQKNTLQLNNQQITKLEVINDPKITHKITRLDLSENILKTASSLQGLKSFPNLTWLNLSHNHLTLFELPRDLEERLLVLNISHNKLTKLPDLKKFGKLKALIANNNEIEEEVEGNKLNAALDTLILSHNKIKRVGDLASLKSLQKLSLSHNQITIFPNNLPESLAELRLNSNQIVELDVIPAKINLLDVGNNQLTDVSQVKKLLGDKQMMIKCLKNLTLKGNNGLRVDSPTELLVWFPRLHILNGKVLPKAKI